MASVLPIFIVKSFTLQKATKQSSNCYNSPGEGAIRTRSSANESKNNCRDAIVYARVLYHLCYASRNKLKQMEILYQKIK